MTAIAGGCFLKRSRSRTAVAETFDKYLSRLGPDGGETVWEDGIVFGYRSFFVSAQDYLSKPLSRVDRCTLVWDGRLDNASALRRELSVVNGGRQDDVESSANLVLKAFVRWGESFAEHLVGDFGFALWDAKRPRLLLARDPFGIRPLYFLRDDGELWWSNEISLLLSLTSRSFELDEEYVAGYLTLTEEPSRTPYGEIVSVNPGCVVIIAQDHVRTLRYWSPEPKRAIRYRSDAEYEEHFRELFSDSLRCRLQARGVVTCELSGGLDSSSIVCLADRLIRGGCTEAKRLETASFLYDESASSDEREFISEVIKKTGVANHRITDYDILSPGNREPEQYLPNPHRCYWRTFTSLERIMKSIGSRVLLTGLCGDHVFVNDPSYWPEIGEMLAQGNFIGAHRFAAKVSRRFKLSYWQVFWMGAIWPWLPIRAKYAFSWKETIPPEWFNQEFAKRTHCRERRVIHQAAASHKNPSMQHRLTMIWGAISASSTQRYREHLCLEVAMPYLHSPLVQFLLEIPSEQFMRPHEDRSLQRRAMLGILPEAIRTRKDKRGPDEPFVRAVRRESAYLTKICGNSVLAELGFVDRRRLLEALERAKYGYLGNSVPLFRAISFEHWLRNGPVATKLHLKTEREHSELRSHDRVFQQ
jgi:asparagine synthase (glutamine-hydrolysing)